MVLALAMSYVPSAKTSRGDLIKNGPGKVDKLYHFE
jgi:hypothetical protein